MVVESLPRMHAGLGVGTQLGLSVSRLLNEFVRSTPVSPADLAASAGRGQRSAVGTYGFFHGGLIAETGKSAEPLAPLAAHIRLPESWRWLLVIPHGQEGLHGSEESRVFAKMCDPVSDFAQGLSVEVHERLLPAGRRGDYAEFSASLYRFGHRSGLSFAAVQGGAYNGPRLQQIVERIRELGIKGVGQSSWGPTIFALCPNEDTAQSVANQIRPSVSDADVLITATCNHGACVVWD
jgi:beta-RFAP synthase